ncbi:MAG: EAL domain-containing protein, partial [Nitriliruptoraceae bacterium]
GRIAYVNPAGEQLLAASAGAAVGGSFTNRLLGTRSDGSPREVEEVLIGDDPEVTLPTDAAEDRLLRNDGTSIPIEYIANELPLDQHGRHNGWVVVFRDITGRIEQQQRLRSEASSARWMARIQDALEHDRFELHAQPIVDILTGEVLQNELLLRLDDPHEGLIAPAEFLPTAEAYGLVTAIDRWVIGRAVGFAARGYPVEVNLSAHSLVDPLLPYLVEGLLDDADAEPSLLVFELTETALLDNHDEAYRFAHRISRLGCQLALDDFGTGYGTFTYLKHLPVDLLKIDREFTRDALRDPASRNVIEAVVNLAHSFGIRTVAEGVEDEPTLALLAELGVDLAQGFHLGRPQLAEQALRAGPRQTE